MQKLEAPGTLNLVLAAAVLGLWISAQLLVHTLSGLALAGMMILGSFVILPLYSLMHECEHGVFHRRRVVNEVSGFVLSVFFPGSFSFLRGCHLGHHKRNRSESERFDVIEEGDSVWRKRAFFYFLYLGGFWLSVPLSMLPLLLHPRWFENSLVQSSASASAMLNGLPDHLFLRIRLECAAVIAFHAAVMLFCGFDWRYAAFMAVCGVNWSAQQYIAHAHSPLDVLNGAHNLRAPAVYEKWLLHFNWHLAHHQNPGVSWLYLPHFNDDTRQRPVYALAFLRFWRGPVHSVPQRSMSSENSS